MRIIAGRFRGRTLVAPNGLETRPTSALARGALFEILRHRIEGARVADLFAGTGALGLEALSRGARKVDFYESGRPALMTLRKNIATLGVGNETRVIQGALPDSLGAGEPYDLLIMDPPWRDGHELRVASRLVSRNRIAKGGLLVIESPRTEPLGEADFAKLGLTFDDRRAYGDTELRFFVREPSPPPEHLPAEPDDDQSDPLVGDQG